MPVTTGATPCWIVTNADGSPAGYEDSEPHYAGEDEARKAAANLTYENEPPPVVKALDHLCSTAITACGYVYDEDEDGAQHWPDSPQEFQDWLIKNADYRLSSSGELLCPLEHGCEECDALAKPAVTAEVPGQMTIGEVA